jgi:Beta-propeller repeat
LRKIGAGRTPAIDNVSTISIYSCPTVTIQNTAVKSLWFCWHGGIFKSIDGGVSWKAVNTCLSSNYILDIAISPLSPQILYAATDMKTDGFVAKLDRAGSALIYSTFLGGRSSDEVSGIALDPSSNVYLVGSTISTDFPLVTPLQPQLGTPLGMPLWSDAFVAKLNAAGTKIIYSTYLGGEDADLGADIAVDACGDAYVTGITYSINFPTFGGIQSVFGGGIDAFISRLDARRGVCHR